MRSHSGTHPPPRDSTAVGRYLWGGRLAESSCVEVFGGHLLGSEGFRRPVLIKRLKDHLASERPLVRAFMEEARLAAQLNHAHIVQVLDVGRRDGAPFIVFEAVDGPRLIDLNQRLARTRVKTLPIPLAVLIANQVLKGLDYAHRHTDAHGRVGVIHQAVRPSTVLISRDGQVKLADFGLPPSVEAQRAAQAAPFAAPEVLGGAPPDARSDLYSVGVLLYQTLTGALPWEGERGSGTRLIPPSERIERVPSALDRIILRALSADPVDRFEDADAFMHHLTMSTAPHFPQATSRDLSRWVERVWKGPSAQGASTALDGFQRGGGSPIPQRVITPISPVEAAAPDAQPARGDAEEEWSLGELSVAEHPTHKEPAWAGGAHPQHRASARRWRSALVAAAGVIIAVGAVIYFKG